MIHTQQRFNFRTKPWPFAQSVMKFVEFNSDEQIGGLLWFVMEELYNANRPFILRTKFTLINVYDTNSKVSFGLCRPPPERFHKPGLLLTFSVRNKPDPRYPDPTMYLYRTFRQWSSHRSTFWGFRWLDNRDYLTVHIPTAMLPHWKFNIGLTTPKLRKIYNTIGMCTKNLVLHSKWFSPTQDIELTDRELDPTNLNSSWPEMLKRPMNTWLASRHIWAEQPGLILPQMLGPYVWNYYLLYLHSMVHRSMLQSGFKDLFELDNGLYKYCSYMLYSLYDMALNDRLSDLPDDVKDRHSGIAKLWIVYNTPMNVQVDTKENRLKCFEHAHNMIRGTTSSSQANAPDLRALSIKMLNTPRPTGNRLENTGEQS